MSRILETKIKWNENAGVVQLGMQAQLHLLRWEGTSKSQRPEGTISLYKAAGGKLWAQAAVSLPALSLCGAHQCPHVSAGSSRRCPLSFLLYIYIYIRIPSLRFYQLERLTQLISVVIGWAGEVGGAAPPPSAPASHFPGCKESVPSPQRAPRLVGAPTRRWHQELPASHRWLSKGAVAGFTPTVYFKGTFSGGREPGVYPGHEVARKGKIPS